MTGARPQLKKLYAPPSIVLLCSSNNHCDLQKFGSFFSEDLEFYHDQGGLTPVSIEHSCIGRSHGLIQFRLRIDVLQSRD